jgi:hypothetical protein
MYRVLPATSLATLFAVGCASAVPPVTGPSVMPVADTAAFRCVQRTASTLGFDRQMRSASGRGALQATTDTNRVTGVYDGMRVRILSDTGHLTSWITASPYTGVVNRDARRAPLMPSRRAIDAAETVERRCRPSGNASVSSSHAPA